MLKLLTNISLEANLVRGAVLSVYIKNVVTICSTLVFLPLLLDQIGTESYGIIAFVVTISSLAAIAEFGITKAATYFSAQLALGHVLCLCAVSLFYFLFCLIFSLSLFLSMWLLNYHFFIGTQSVGATIFLIGGLLFANNIILFFLRGVLEGRKKFIEVNIGHIISTLLNFPLLYFISLSKVDINILVFAMLLAPSLILLLHLIQVREVVRGAMLRNFQWNYLKEVFGYAKNVYLINIPATGFVPLTRIFVAFIANSTSVIGLFDLALRLGNISNSFLSAWSIPYLAIFSEKKGDSSHIHKVVNIIKGTLIFYALCCLVFFVIGGTILEYLGYPSEEAFWVALVVIAGAGVNGVVESAYRYMLAHELFSVPRKAKFALYPSFALSLVIINLICDMPVGVLAISLSYWLANMVSAVIMITKTLNYRNYE